MSSLISIIVPVYNVEKYLERCIKSLVEQDYTNIEMIFVNDGATDKSGEILTCWAGKDQRIRVFEKKNEGISSARNFGIDKARGEYLFFVDSDDYILSTCISELYDNAIKGDYDIVIGGLSRLINDEIVKSNCNVDTREYSCEEYLYDMYTNTNSGENLIMFLPLVSVWGNLYKRHIFDSIRFPKGRIYEDNAIVHRVIYASNKILWLNKELYIYRIREKSITNSEFNMKKLDEIDAQNDRLSFLSGKIENTKLWEEIIVRCLNTSRRYLAILYREYPEQKDILDIEYLRYKENYKKYSSVVDKNRISGCKLFANCKAIYLILDRVRNKNG